MNWLMQILFLLAAGVMGVAISVWVTKSLSEEMLRKQEASIELFRAHPYREVIFHFAGTFLSLSLLEDLLSLAFGSGRFLDPVVKYGFPLVIAVIYFVGFRYLSKRMLETALSSASKEKMFSCIIVAFVAKAIAR